MHTVDRRVEGRKALLSGHVVEPAVERHEINHFFLHVLVDGLHVRSSLLHLRKHDRHTQKLTKPSLLLLLGRERRRTILWMSLMQLAWNHGVSPYSICRAIKAGTSKNTSNTCVASDSYCTSCQASRRLHFRQIAYLCSILHVGNYKCGISIIVLAANAPGCGHREVAVRCFSWLRRRGCSSSLVCKC